MPCSILLRAWQSMYQTHCLASVPEHVCPTIEEWYATPLAVVVHSMSRVPFSETSKCIYFTQIVFKCESPNGMLHAETLAGFCVGLSETLVGFPFVTAKVLIQNRQAWWKLPFARYYYGVRYPLISSVGFNSLVFPLKDYLHDERGLSYAVAGCLAGVAVSPQMFFIDTFTIRAQTNQKVSLQMFRHSKGFGMTVARECVALSTYFGSYHKCRETHGSFVSGAVAGLCNWTLSFPLDTIRTRQIAQRCTIRNAFAQKRLWRGFGIAASRAVIVNACSFTVYENVLHVLK